MDLKEAIQEISALTREASEARELPRNDPRTQTFVIGGVKHDYERPEPPRAHRVKTLADLIALANRFAADADEDHMPAVWFAEDKVVLVIDDDGHRIETVTLALEVSDVFAVLIQLRK